MNEQTLAKLRRAPLGQLGELYIAYRDRRDAIRQREKDLVAILEQLAALILGRMPKEKTEGFRANGHVFYPYDFVSATVNDPEAFINNIIETEDYDLIERRASKDACEAYAAANATEENPKGTPPPGVTIVTIVKLGARKV